ncbi:MAG TPA: hypothetical protein VFM46_15780, partial [Pseudomonadales bacterium]|nr:hypothetical protein [Pseudomonadales bacterium]
NDPEDVKLISYLNQINDLGDPRLRVIQIDENKALPGLFNFLATFASGEYLVFFHPDNAIVYADWLDTLLGYAQRQEVGLVSPRMVDSRYRIRGAGYIAGLNGAAQALFSDQLLDHDGYAGRAKLTQNFTALPAGCLMTKRVIFEAAGGFNEERYAWAYYEVDLAWRIYQAGLLNVWTPSVSILAEQEAPEENWKLVRFREGEKDKLFKQAEENLAEQWVNLMGHDPYYNVNLRLTGDAFKIDMRTAMPRNPLPWKPLKRIMALPADLQGCGHYRIISPARHLLKHGKATTLIAMDHYTPAEIDRFELDSMVMQRQLLPHQTAYIKRYKDINKDTFLVFEVDDLFTHVPVKSLHRKELPKNISALLRDSLKLFDRLVVSTAPIKEAYSGLIDDIRVVNNRIEKSIWGDFKPARRGGKKPRVGWAGGVSHTGDLQIIADVVRETANEVDWVFLGMFPEGTRAYIAE